MKKNYLFIVLTSIFINFSLLAQPSGYSYGKKITIDNTKVSGSGSHTNFPVLISLTDNDLRTTGNSGYVQSSNGYDIIFTSGNGSTTYSHEIEKYNASTGEFVAWVNVPSLSATANTEINMYYGNSSIASNPSSTSTWNSDYIVNMHMDDDPTGTIGNSSQQTFTASSFGSMTSSDIVTGKIGSGTDFDGSNDGYSMTRNTTLDLNTNDFTFSCWFKTDAMSGTQILFNKKPSGGGVDGFGAVSVQSSGTLNFYFKASGGTQTSTATSTTVSANTWYNFHITCDVANDVVKIYLNGSLISTVTVDAGASLANGQNQHFGCFNSSSSYFNGVLDEMRIALTDFSADWIATEYNNQSSPSTFYSVSTHQTAASVLPVELIHFEAQAAANHTTELKWTTVSEINNRHFEIERSYDGKIFDVIGEVAGNGNSQHAIEYSFLDETISLIQNTAYYRLKQVDFDGAFEYSNERVVSFDGKVEKLAIAAYPNPSNQEVTIRVNTNEPYSIEVTNSNGLLLLAIDNTKSQTHRLDLTEWTSGVYIVNVTSPQGTKHLKVIKQ
jgi:biopolymer transport protein ExbB